jgi:hypothetical protein
LATLILGLFLYKYFQPLAQDINYGDTSQIQIGLISLFLLIRFYSTTALSDYCSGFFLGCILMFKPNVLYMVLLLMGGWLIQRRNRALLMNAAGLVTAIVFSIGISTLIFGNIVPWIYWLETIFKSMPNFYFKEYFSKSFFQQNFFLGQIFMSGIFCLFALGVSKRNNLWKIPKIMSGSPIREGNEYFDQEYLLASIGLLIFLFSGLAKPYHFLFILPGAVFLLRPKLNAKYNFHFLFVPVSIYLANESSAAKRFLGGVILFALCLHDLWDLGNQNFIPEDSPIGFTQWLKNLIFPASR